MDVLILLSVCIAIAATILATYFIVHQRQGRALRHRRHHRIKL